ncbi:sensor histidine kinase [Kaistia granuli]|uniref:sensor histidine kinase n=1 Tax=Kaistia granuli TaxID=363259 RepID=UPI0009FE0CCF|nr:ATP-binding protein [Kaistia granuli]
MMTLSPDIVVGDDSVILPVISSFTDQESSQDKFSMSGGPSQEEPDLLRQVAPEPSEEVLQFRLKKKRNTARASSEPGPFKSIEVGAVDTAVDMPVSTDSRPASWSILTRERQRLSRDIHDVSGQYIVSMLFRLAAIEKTVTDPRLLSDFVDLRKTLTHFSEELQQVAAGGRVGVPPGYYLVTALTDLVERWQGEIGIATRFRHRGMNRPDVDDRTAETVYRIIQEALTNIAKHAATASTVSIRLRRMPDYLMLQIEDDGSGPGAAILEDSDPKRRRSGVVGMSQRVAELGGTFSIRPRRGAGTRLLATIPLKTSILRRPGGEAR